MKGLLIWLAITIPALSGALWHFGDGEELWNERNAQEEVAVEEVVEVELTRLEEIALDLEGLNALEIQSYLDEHSIQYEFEQTSGYPHDQWCIIVPEGEDMIHIHWYDDKVEEVLMSIEKIEDGLCLNALQLGDN